MPEDFPTEFKLTSNLPLVTFAVFAYNQEKYIRQAVEGAFAQTYEPLEIILSDDCSTDRTLAIMQEMASSYHGTKKVVVRKTVGNRGTLLHVVEVAKLAQGKLLIIAAGDDISKPERTEALVEAWLESGSWALCSRFDMIDDHGRLTAQDEISPWVLTPDYPIRKPLTHGELRGVHGATAAYDLQLFALLDTRPEDFILTEDYALGVSLSLLGKNTHIVNDSLVLYRESEDSISNRGKSGPPTFYRTLNDERKSVTMLHSLANAASFVLRFNERLGVTAESRLDASRLHSQLRSYSLRAKWHGAGFLGKTKLLIMSPGPADLKWCIPRLLPMRIFAAAKTFILWARFAVRRVIKPF